MNFTLQKAEGNNSHLWFNTGVKFKYNDMTTVANTPVWLAVYLQTSRNDVVDKELFSILQDTFGLITKQMHKLQKELKITPILDKLLEYKRNWIQLVNRMPRNRLPRVMKRYSPTGRRNHGRPLKRLLDTCDRNGSTSGPTP